MKLKIKTRIKSIERNEQGELIIDQEIVSVRRNVLDEIKDRVMKTTVYPLQHPDETKRIQDQAVLEEQKEILTILRNNYADDDIGQGIALTPQQAKKYYNYGK